MAKLRIPVGEENFEWIRKNGCYYVDKTKLIVELLQDLFKVNLITRPRRFGKTLTMSMLKNFFDIRKDSREIFAGLTVLCHEELCKEWMNQWPVIFLTLKDVASRSFEMSYEQLAYTISDVCVEHAYLGRSEKADEADRACFERLKTRNGSRSEVGNSLYMLMRMMYAHYGKPVILLIDEYDVPLAKAREYGYYEEMLDVIRGLMSKSFKTNDYLQFAVITGCLRIARESIFTGTNNFVSNSIYRGSYQDAVGFTEEEVVRLLEDAGLGNHLADMKRWYDGYSFGKYDIYCPWDVVRYTAELMREPELAPQNYWKDTSHNDIIRQFIGMDGMDVNRKMEILLSGGSIRSRIKEDSTYRLEDASEEDFWSILYLTGYLTIDRDVTGDGPEELLRIPNQEIRTIFGDTIAEWFQEEIGVKAGERKEMFAAWWKGDEHAVTEAVSVILNDVISYFDYKEDYYHAFVAGLFSGAGYLITSNEENGLGRADVVVKDRKNRKVLVIEIKHSASGERMAADAAEALRQIDLKQYASKYLYGYKEILCYGAAFYQKRCVIRKAVTPGGGAGSVYEIL